MMRGLRQVVFLLIWPAIILLFASTRKDRRGAQSNPVFDKYGAIVRGDTSRKELALVFTGDEFADGGGEIRETLKTNQVPGAFFLTGNFYANPSFSNLILALKGDGHYLGPHSDKHLLYADWTKRDSLLVSEEIFKSDLRMNYVRMRLFGVSESDAPYFIPPYEWYNRAIVGWTRDLGLQLVNYSSGTYSTADYTYPEMNGLYRSSEQIYQSITDFESNSVNGMNGFILLVHIGTDPRRTDKFYNRLDELIRELKERGYCFVTINQLLN